MKDGETNFRGKHRKEAIKEVTAGESVNGISLLSIIFLN